MIYDDMKTVLAMFAPHKCCAPERDARPEKIAFQHSPFLRQLLCFFRQNFLSICLMNMIFHDLGFELCFFSG